jgi:hypothetical protein
VSGVAHKDKQQQKQLHFYRHEPIPDVSHLLLCCSCTSMAFTSNRLQCLHSWQLCYSLLLCRTGGRMDTGDLHTGEIQM